MHCTQHVAVKPGIKMSAVIIEHVDAADLPENQFGLASLISFDL
jgi:hypothetical protein